MTAFGSLRALLYRLFIPAILAFVCYIGAGYFTAFANAFPSHPWLATMGITSLLVVLLYVSLVHAAWSVVVVRLRRSLGLWPVMILSIVFMLMISAYGAFTASMLFFEGPVILRENLIGARDAVLRLDAATGEALRMPGLEALRSRIASLRRTLEAEIDNPVFCGIGPKAKEAIEEIRKDLPNLRILNGTDRPMNCRDRVALDRLKQSYGELIEGQFAEHPIHGQLRVAERRRATEEIAASLRGQREIVDRALARLNGVTHLVGKIELFDATKLVLVNAASAYASAYQRLAGFANAATLQLPPRIDVSPVEQIGSSLHIFDTIWARARKTTTYVYLVAAVLADLLAIGLTYNAIDIDRRRQDRRRRGLIGQMSTTEVQYLWSPMSHPARD